MGPASSSEHRRAFRELERLGLLLMSDPALPCVTRIVAGEPIRGSWWGHPRGHAIYHVLTRLAESPDVLAAKLLAGKVTFIHRALWPAFLAVARSREPWQMQPLPAAARSLLRRVDREGTVRTDELSPRRSSSAAPLRAAVRALEAALLVHADEIHTETGAHAKVLESWHHWQRRVGFPARPIPIDRAKQELAAAARRLCGETGGTARLPWEVTSRAGGRGRRPRGPGDSRPDVGD